MEENSNRVRKKLPVMAHVAMRVPLLFAFNNLFGSISSSWKQLLDRLFEIVDGVDITEFENTYHPFLHLILCLLGVICVFLLFILPSRILSKLYILIISGGILQASYWWSEQFLVKLHSNSSTEQWDVMFHERPAESWRQLHRQQIIFSRDLLVYAILQSSYASLFAILLGQHIDMFLPRAVTFCNLLMFLPVSVAILCHKPGVEVSVSLISMCQWFTIVVAIFVIILWIWSLTAVSNTLRFKEFLQMMRTIRRDLGLQVLFEHEWKRLQVPTLLRVFWLSNSLWLAARHYVSLGNLNNDFTSQLNWSTLTGVASEVAIAGCGSITMLLGMSAVIAKIANQIGCLIHMIIKSTDDEEKYIGTVSAVLFFILALQTGLTELEGEVRLVRLFRNSCLLFTAILHFIHNMLNQVMLSLGASQSTSFKRHIRVLSVALFLLIVPFLLFYYLWTSYEMSTWILAVSAFCLELCIKVLVTTSVYTLFMIDAFWNTYWENLDDYVYYLKGTGSVIEFLFGIFLFFNGGWILLFESGGIIRAFMMSIHAYFNIFVQAKEGWKMFQNRRTAVSKIDSLPFATASELSGHDDVCAICYHELLTARVTPCGHMFHGMCLRKWLYLQDVCPMCQKKLVEKIVSEKKNERDEVELLENEDAAALENDPGEYGESISNSAQENLELENIEQENATEIIVGQENQFDLTDSEDDVLTSDPNMIIRRRRHNGADRDIFTGNDLPQTDVGKHNGNGQSRYIDSLEEESESSLSSSLDDFDE